MWTPAITSIFLLLIRIDPIYGWDHEELELFDVVEDVNANFYEVLGVEQSASSAEIRRAYRKLSVKLHPDKNKEEGAEENFRKLAAVYEILRDDQRRQRYNEILVNGLPDWRTPVYYYRKARKLGLVELAILLLVIFTIGHFLVIWSMYLERKFELEEVFTSKKKRDKRGKKARLAEREAEALDEALQVHINTLHRPTLADLIPCKMVMGMITLFLGIPSYVEEFKRWREERKMRKEMVEEEESEEEECEEKIKKSKRRQRVDIPEFQPDMATDTVPVVYYSEKTESVEEKQDEKPTIDKKGTEWTDHEISLLAKAVTKFPSGTLNRWEKIAAMVERSVSEVTTKSKEIKNRVTMSVDPASQGLTGSVGEKLAFKKGKTLTSDISQRQWSQNQTLKADSPESQSPHPPNKTSPDSGDTGAKDKEEDKAKAVDKASLWTQSQQKALEIALAQFPKGTPDRWDRVSEQITGKSKEDCLARFKHLAETIKRRKMEAEIAKR